MLISIWNCKKWGPRRWCKIDGVWVRYSHYVWNKYHPEDLIELKGRRGPKANDFCIHHKNENQLDDRIRNLQKMTQSDHQKLKTGKHLSKEHCEAISRGTKKYVHTEEHNRHASEAKKGMKYKMVYVRTEEHNRHISEAKKGMKFNQEED